MAGLLDYYKEHPELWKENESLVAKAPAYDLGMMDLRRMNLEEMEGGKPMTGLTKFLGYTLPNVFGFEQSSFSPIASPLGTTNLRTGDITLRTGPFTKGDVPTSYGEENFLPVYNLDKAQIMAHENRHYLTNAYPELYDAQPDWSTLDEKRWPKRSDPPSKSRRWRQEAFNRYLDSLDYPALPFRTPTSVTLPVGLSGINRIGGIKPTDAYFDKIWRDKWKPHATRYNKILKKIAARQNVRGTPIVPMDAAGRGRDAPSGDWSPGVGGGQRGSNAPGFTDPGRGSYGPWKSRGGIIGAF